MSKQLIVLSAVVLSFTGACGGGSVANDDRDPGLVTAVDLAPFVAGPDLREASDGAKPDTRPPPFVEQVDDVTVSTLAGSGVAGTQEGTGAAARFANPTGIAVDEGGTLYVTEYDGHRVRRVTKEGETSPLVYQPGFALPFAITVLGPGLLMVQTDADDAGIKSAGSGTLWQIALPQGVLQKVVGELGRPRALASLGGGQLLVADRTRATVSILTAASGVMAVLAQAPALESPTGVGVLPNGSFVVADANASVIRLLAPDNTMTIFAGHEGQPGMVDAPSASAYFDRPLAIAVDAAGNVYVSDQGDNHRIRRVTPGGMVETIAGTGEAGFADGGGATAQFYGQEGLALAPQGDVLYIADGNSGDGSFHHRIRKIELPRAAN